MIQLTREHLKKLTSAVTVPELPPEDLALEETICICQESLKEGYLCQRELDLFKVYIGRREIRALIIHDTDGKYTEILNSFNYLEMDNTKVRLKIKKTLDDAL